eukprot:CAMPEP_0202351344 /NCGR_PEP_ID=MMETSP1126-20121109/8028_1 /ASSEMBLY_ACC=CAM_ASM_000457 /TAXON_ID=3047 /ORGANISM="Dunaliella tertiolecta, Strain CCMP1320" /LENGTH=250 /DNA_ID=CAMNT_0048943445 /DNA_START=245 /DNA_END=999 /DNA_ORIENTATION=+
MAPTGAGRVRATWHLQTRQLSSEQNNAALEAAGATTAGRTAASGAERGGVTTDFARAASGRNVGPASDGMVGTSVSEPLQGQQQPQQHASDQWVEGEVELRCTPATEGAVYAAFEPPPMLPHHMLPQCPVGWAVGGAAQDVHARLPTLGEDGVSDLACACLRRFPGLSHFGPQEDPEAVARDVLTFFTHDVHRCKRGEGVQRRWEVIVTQAHPKEALGLSSPQRAVCCGVEALSNQKKNNCVGALSSSQN